MQGRCRIQKVWVEKRLDNLKVERESKEMVIKVLSLSN